MFADEPIDPAFGRMSDGPPTPHEVFTTPSELPAVRLQGNDASLVIHRSASHTQLASESNVQASFPPDKSSTISRSFSENAVANAAGDINSANHPTPRPEASSNIRKISLKRLNSAKRRPPQQESDSRFAVSKFIIGAEQSLENITGGPSSPDDGRTPERDLKARSVSASLTKFARKSWASASRSPSPSASKRRSHKDDDRLFEHRGGYIKSVDLRPDADNGITTSSINSTHRKNSILSRRPKRPLDSFLSKGLGHSNDPLVPPIPKSFSTDKLPSLKDEPPTLINAPLLPNPKAFEKLHAKDVEKPRKKDDLWSIFRNLDGEYQKFQSRSSTLKTAIVRSALLPFLRSYAEHPSISGLRLEDLDRRTVILNKWWTGLLEMLNGRHGESVSGNDRPAILEAVTALMVRPEWTLPVAVARSSRTPRPSLKSRSTTSLGSIMTMSSDFLADSVYHNVRNTFTQNLLAQMAYVVDKMSARSVAASVVAFCGKATAYAFIYCEGVAEMLVRLWNVRPQILRRILAENGAPKDTKLGSVSDDICTLFPRCLHSLTFRSLQSLTSHLRCRPHVPIATAYIPWQGPWIGRWTGQDTDLFYVFTKFYTDLVCRFLPDDPTTEEKLATPGWLLVQGQILSMLDATMQRFKNQPPSEKTGSYSVTFDDILGEVDASATVLPLPAHTALRSMAENRLILLLRDCLSGSTIMTGRTQSIFALSFSTSLKAAAKKISIFDHNACFALCDFLEEALAILTRYYQASNTVMAFTDWTFWFDTCKLMLQSNNSMTEVRLFAFLYAMWPIFTSQVDRKKDICLHWLLTKDVFRTNFNHWCPMVRAFFMRLLLWRIARVDGRIATLDNSILEVLAERLQESWRQFLYIQMIAGRAPVAAPSTAAPGRRLLIVKNDIPPAPAGVFLTFDAILSSSSTLKYDPCERQSAIDPLPQSSPSQSRRGIGGHSASNDHSKKRWSLFKNIVPTATSSSDRPKSGSSQSKREIAEVSQTDTEASSDKGVDRRPHYRSLSFKFSLDWLEQGDIPGGQERRLHPPKIPLLTQQGLILNHSKGPINTPLKPEGVAVGPSKYTGKALAEWALLLAEFRTFFERRKAEGVPTYWMVETPTLGVDPFRKI